VVRWPVGISISCLDGSRLDDQALENPARARAPSADLSITVTEEAAVARPRAIYTIVLANAGTSDVTGAVVTDSFRDVFTGVNLTATQDGGASNRALIAETDGSARFSFEITPQTSARSQDVSRTPVCAPGSRKEQDLILLLRIG
jgi:uncharacterized repeat protein (TIGR01451 family)